MSADASKLIRQLVLADVNALLGDGVSVTTDDHAAAIYELIKSMKGTNKTAAAREKWLLELFKDIFVAFWGVLIRRKFEGLAPTDLSRSATFELLSRLLHDEGKLSDAITLGGLTTWWIFNDKDLPTLADDAVAERFLGFLQFFVEEVAVKCWGARDPWSEKHMPADESGLLCLAANAGSMRLVSFLLAKGKDPNGSFDQEAGCAPLFAAFVRSREAVFDLLLEQGVDLIRPYSDGTPASIALICIFRQERPPMNESQVRMLRKLFVKCPQALVVTENHGNKWETDALGTAAFLGSAPLVRVLMEAGAKIRCHLEISPSGGELRPTLCDALTRPNIEMLELLIGEYGALDDWRERYNDAGCRCLAQVLAEFAVEAYEERAKANSGSTSSEPSCAMTVLDAMLASGFVCSKDAFRCNPFILATLRSELPCAEAISLLCKVKAAGFDVTHFSEDTHDKGPGMLLSHTVASMYTKYVGKDQQDLMDFAILEAGCPVDAMHTNKVPDGIRNKHMSALTTAIVDGADDLALHLISRHNASVVYPDSPWGAQPIMQLIVSPAMPERRRLAVLRELPCFHPEGDDVKAIVMTPVSLCVVKERPKELAMIFESGMSGADEMAHRVHQVQGARDMGTPAQISARLGDWESLAVFVRLSKVRVTYKWQPTPGDTRAPLPSVLEFVALAQRRRDSALPRTLAALVISAGKREVEEGSAKAQARERAAAKTGATTNAFEDPSLKPLTEKEAKAKAKKKAAKKKAKAKKKAARAASAGAGGAIAEAEESNDDDSDSEDEPFEEPDDNLVDSRYAPNLDLMLAAMGIVPDDESAGAAGAASAGAGSAAGVKGEGKNGGFRGP